MNDSQRPHVISTAEQWREHKRLEQSGESRTSASGASLAAPPTKLSRADSITWFAVIGPVVAVAVAAAIFFANRDSAPSFKEDTVPEFSLSAAPSEQAALDFLERYSALINRAIKATPSGVSGIELARKAQAQYAIDGPRVAEWQKAGITLFIAAAGSTGRNPSFFSCLDALRAARAAWEIGYPLNGRMRNQDENEQRREEADRTRVLSAQCREDIAALK